MSEAFTTYWSRDRLQNFKKYHPDGDRLTMLFGGPHTSLPGFRRAGVQPGDAIYPVSVHKGILYLLGRMRVRQILTLEEYIGLHPDHFEPYRTAWPTVTFDNYLADHPELRYLAPTCVEEVLLGEDGTRVRLDIAVPYDGVERLRFRSQRRERGIKHLENGLITKVLSLQGNYRLAPPSASQLEAVLMDGLKAKPKGAQF